MARFENEDGPENVKGGHCNVECLKPWAPEACAPARVPAFVRDLSARLHAEAPRPEIARLRAAGVVL